MYRRLKVRLLRPLTAHVSGQRCHSFIQHTIASAFFVSQLTYDTVKALMLPDVMLSGCFRQTVLVLLAHDRSY